jgi:hypothetical protein
MPSHASCEDNFGYEGFSGRWVLQGHNWRKRFFFDGIFGDLESLLGIRTGAQNGVSQIAKCPLQNSAAKIER